MFHKEAYWLRLDQRPYRRKSGTKLRRLPKESQKKEHRHGKDHKRDGNRHRSKPAQENPGIYKNYGLFEEDEQMLDLNIF